MNKWNAIGFLTVNTLLLGFFASATNNEGMKVLGFVMCILNGMVAVAGTTKR